MYKAIEVADYIVNKSIDLDCPVSNLKLQKLLYYVQAAKIVISDNKESMFDENICAWKYGPVVKNVYHIFKINVDKKITEKVTLGPLYIEGDVIKRDPYNPKDVISDEDQLIINEVIESYENFSPLQMVRKTHKEKPWIDAYTHDAPYIKSDSIYNFYNQYSNLIYGDK